MATQPKHTELQPEFQHLYSLLTGKLLKCQTNVDNKTYYGQFNGIHKHIDAGFCLRDAYSPEMGKAWTSVIIFSMHFGTLGGSSNHSNYSTSTIQLSGEEIIITSYRRKWNKDEQDDPPVVLRIYILGDAFID